MGEVRKGKENLTLPRGRAILVKKLGIDHGEAGWRVGREGERSISKSSPCL